MKTKIIDSLKIDYTADTRYHRMTYLLMPISISEDHVDKWCALAHTNLAIVTGLDWDNDLTPWPAAAVPKGTGDFKGLAPQLLERLRTKVMPGIESDVPTTLRNLIGISLSGLFALWAWMQAGDFENVCCLSGSFWYEGFVQWLQTYPIPEKTGAILFELGKQEPLSRQPVFATVGKCTEAVVERLKQAGISTQFEWVPGTHYSPIEPRLHLALAFLSTR